MANNKVRQLLAQLREETENGISDLQQSEEIDAWLDEQSALTAACCNDRATVVQLLEQELSARGISLRTH
jgi:hypothetical protein